MIFWPGANWTIGILSTTGLIVSSSDDNSLDKTDLVSADSPESKTNRILQFEQPDSLWQSHFDGSLNLLVLDSGESEQTRAVLSSELSSEDDTIKPVSDKIPIVQLAPGQKIKVECYARLGRGTEHAKWNASNISTLTDTDKDDEKVLTVESTGALNPEEIVLEGVQEVSRRVVEFKDMINNIEE